MLGLRASLMMAVMLLGAARASSDDGRRGAASTEPAPSSATADHAADATDQLALSVKGAGE